MGREMLQNNTTLHKIVKIKLGAKCLSHDELELTTVELFEEICCKAFELMVTVVDTESTFNLQKFSHKVNHDIVKEDDYDHLLWVVISVICCIEDSA